MVRSIKAYSSLDLWAVSNAIDPILDKKTNRFFDHTTDEPIDEALE
jgi:hypothetical protein